MTALAVVAVVGLFSSVAAQGQSGTQEDLSALQCPSASECVAVDTNGREFTFDPRSRAPNTSYTLTTDPSAGNAALPTPDASIVLAGPAQFTALACPSTRECVADGFTEGYEVTFDPLDPSVRHINLIDNFGVVPTIACVSTNECTAVDNRGTAITFEPTSGKVIARATLPDSIEAATACPTDSQCTVIDEAAGEVTFDPADPAHHTKVRVIAPGGSLDDVACPTASRCLATNATGTVSLFAPTGSLATRLLRVFKPRPGPVLADPSLTVACPGARRCVIADGLGELVSLEPAHPGRATKVRLRGRPWLGPLACPSTTDCAALSGGRMVVVLNPSKPQGYTTRVLAIASAAYRTAPLRASNR